jgi:uncharacterized protein (DUF2461 family)
MAAMEKQMQAMKAMREKLAAAKTPDERRAVMAEHMKTMHDSMAMMDMMRSPTGSGAMGTMPMMEAMHHRHQMMEKRMEMMNSIMRMMMDRMQ